ncbi:MAG: hypothetical protein AABY26_06600 [Nanoarchaeota archaeon]
MLWPQKDKKFEEEIGTLSLLQGMPEGFFRCNECQKVLPTNKLGPTVWGGEKASYVCKNCLGLVKKGPEIPAHLVAKDGEKPRNVKRY